MSDADSWDDRYRTAEFVWKTDPNRFLPPEVAELKRGRALDLACGEGRNAVWLATQGWNATGVDYSQVGLDKAAQLAESNHVTATWICADVTKWEPEGLYDLVVVFYIQLPERSDESRSVPPHAHSLQAERCSSSVTISSTSPKEPAARKVPPSSTRPTMFASTATRRA